MAIVQASLADEILSRQERAVIRGVYRASQLAEALSTLQKIQLAYSTSLAPQVGSTLDIKQESLNSIAMYLRSSIAKAIESTKVPAISQPDQSESGQKA